MLAIDHFTQWVEVQVIPSKTSKNIIRFIRDCLVARHGCPLVIQTNGGKPYVSQAINWFLEGYSIKHTVSAPYHPKSNGMAKQTIQTLKGIMAKLKLKNIKKWKEHINKVVTAY